ncbi:MAG: hypothetical protein AAB381_01380 [Patescibacteria group bacterium]
MNKNFTLRKVASVVGLMGGAFALSVAAQTVPWTAAPSSPPNCNLPGCNAPLNTGTGAQIKQGDLSIGLDDTYNPTINGGLIFTKGLLVLSDAFYFNPDPNVTIAPGSVLTTPSGDGTISWQAPAGATASGVRVYDSPGIWTVPAGVTKVNVEVWSAGQTNGRSGGYAYKHAIPVTPGGTQTIVVGTNAAPASWFGGASYGASAAGVAADGLSGRGDYTIQGSRGFGGYANGNGGDAPRGGSGAKVEGNAPGTCYPARIPGGGGGGAPCFNGDEKGANGRVIIWY